MDVTDLTQRRRASPNGAGHYHIAERYPYRVRVIIEASVVATSDETVILKEIGKSVYHPSFYIPPADVDLGRFQREDGYSTHCPIKGDASYWQYVGEGGPIDRAAWSYDDPLEYSEAIAGHLGFDQRFFTLEISPIRPS